MRSYRDRDFIESVEGLVFCVIGNIHPQDRVVSYLKYVAGYKSSIRVKWSRNGIEYGRILPFYSAIGVSETMDFLRKNYPYYIVFDEYRSIELIEVPKDHIKIHYKPEEKAMDIVRNPRDSLEELAKDLIENIASRSGVKTKDFGVTGSILLGIHNLMYSDIDLVVYGRENSYRVRETLNELFSDSKSGFSKPSGDMLVEWARDIARIHPLTIEEAMKLYRDIKWNRALYKGRQFSLHPVKIENEVSERWEDKIYRPIGLATIRARIIDATDSIFMPAIYVIDDVHIIDGVSIPNTIRFIVSYEGLYIDIAKEGEYVVAYGKVEKVIDLKMGEEYYQLTIGTYEARGKDYIKPVKWFTS